MVSLVFAGSFSPVELGLIVLIVLTLVVPIALAVLIERFVYKGRAADPVGFAEFEDRFKNGDTWTEQLYEDRDD